MENGNKYRLQKINEIQKELEVEKENRRRLEKKYKKGIKAVNILDYVLAVTIMGSNVVGVSLVSTIVAAPAVITTGTITMGASMLFILSRQINRKLTATVKKHKELGNLIEEVLNKISNDVSIALKMIIKSRMKSLVSFCRKLMRLRKEKKKIDAMTKETTDIKSDIVEPFLQKIALKKR